jgi:hypothetical protein
VRKRFISPSFLYLSPFAWLQFTLVEAEMISDQERERWFFYETMKEKKILRGEEKKRGVPSKK